MTELIIIILLVKYLMQVSPTRTILPITALLALITQQIQSNLNVSYIYAMQVWNIVCIIFVFASLLEYAIALYVMHMDHKRKAQKAARRNVEANNSEAIKEKSTKTKMCTRMCKHFQTNSRCSAVDKISRYLFPFLYGLFIVVFAIYCTID